MIKKLAIFLSIVGLAVSTYLLLSKVTGQQLECNLSTCGVVNDSKYAYIAGIPVSAFGVLFYTGMIITLLLNRYKLFFIGSITGVIFSAYLTYLEAFVIHAWCQWCLLSAWLTMCLFIVALRLRSRSVTKV